MVKKLGVNVDKTTQVCALFSVMFAVGIYSMLMDMLMDIDDGILWAWYSHIQISNF